MKSYNSINSKTIGKLLNTNKLTTKGKQEILKAAQKRSMNRSLLSRLARKIEFIDSITNKNKQL